MKSTLGFVRKNPKGNHAAKRRYMSATAVARKGEKTRSTRVRRKVSDSIGSVYFKAQDSRQRGGPENAGGKRRSLLAEPIDRAMAFSRGRNKHSLAKENLRGREFQRLTRERKQKNSWRTRNRGEEPNGRRIKKKKRYSRPERQ